MKYNPKIFKEIKMTQVKQYVAQQDKDRNKQEEEWKKDREHNPQNPQNHPNPKNPHEKEECDMDKDKDRNRQPQR